MTDSDPTPSGDTGTALTRFNALRHGVLSRYTVLPWEAAGEYHALVAALVAEHGPQGADRGASGRGTSRHSLAQAAAPGKAAAQRRGLNGTLASYRETAKVALAHLDATDQAERVVDAIRATASETDEDVREMREDEAMTRRALDLLGSPQRPPRGGAGDAARGYAGLVGGSSGARAR